MVQGRIACRAFSVQSGLPMRMKPAQGSAPGCIPLGQGRLRELEEAFAASLLAQRTLAGGGYDQVGIQLPGGRDLLGGNLAIHFVI